MNDPREVRRAIRRGGIPGIPQGRAGVRAGQRLHPAARVRRRFRAFCERNPKPCPLLAMSRPGDPRLPELGADLDIRTDVPRYRVFVDGGAHRGGRRPAALLARRPGDLRARLLVLLRGSAAGSRIAAALRRAGPQRADVPHQRGDGAGRPLPRQAGGVDAAVQAGRCDPRDRDHRALPRVHGAPVHIGVPT